MGRFLMGATVTRPACLSRSDSCEMAFLVGNGGVSCKDGSSTRLACKTQTRRQPRDIVRWVYLHSVRIFPDYVAELSKGMRALNCSSDPTAAKLSKAVSPPAGLTGVLGSCTHLSPEAPSLGRPTHPPAPQPCEGPTSSNNPAAGLCDCFNGKTAHRLP